MALLSKKVKMKWMDSPAEVTHKILPVLQTTGDKNTEVDSRHSHVQVAKVGGRPSTARDESRTENDHFGPRCTPRWKPVSSWYPTGAIASMRAWNRALIAAKTMAKYECC